jgi:hypothetical protein
MMLLGQQPAAVFNCGSCLRSRECIVERLSKNKLIQMHNCEFLLRCKNDSKIFRIVTE